MDNSQETVVGGGGSRCPYAHAPMTERYNRYTVVIQCPKCGERFDARVVVDGELQSVDEVK